MENSFSSNKSVGFGQKIKCLAVGIVIGFIAAFALTLAWKMQNPKPNQKDVEVIAAGGNIEEPAKPVKKEVTLEFVNKKLENLGELSTAQMSYTGIYSVVEGSIPFITQKGFSMVYTATIRAGIDMSLIKVEITSKNVIVRLPEPEIQMIKVDPSTIQFYDEKRALFNRDEKTDVTEAIQIAEKDLQEKTDLTDLLNLTSERAELLVKNLLMDVIEEKELVVI